MDLQTMGLEFRTTTDTIIVDDLLLPCDDIDSESKVNSSLSVSSSSYGWLGNQWIPPKHVPFYTPEMMRALFGRQKVLWVGDSTARQDHATMWSMLNATNVQDVTVEALERDIQKYFDFCEEGLRQEFVSKCYQLQPLQTNNNTNNNNNNNTNNSMLTTTTLTWNSYGNNGTTRHKTSRNEKEEKEEEEGFFDLYNHSVHFLDTIPSFWNQSQFGLAQHQYSAVVISVGVWEMSAGRCRNRRQVRTDLLRALESTRDFVWEYNYHPSSQNKTISNTSNNNKKNINTNTATSTTNRPLTVFWKTHGMTTHLKHGRNRKCGDMIHTVTREWFLSESTKTKTTTTTTTTMTRRNNVLEEEEIEHHHYHDPNDPHMILVDFGLQIEPRAYDEKRIHGDHAFHFGAEARTLSMQMLSHEMHKSICRKKNNNE
jgi:hypothetical protein